MKTIVKVVWSQEMPFLKLATETGFEKIELKKGRRLDYDLTGDRRCTGFHSDRSVMEPCPEFRSISSGDQCRECRGKDIYTGWRIGNQAPKGEDGSTDHSVYLAQCSKQTKVGVTRSSRLKTRWLEQGADYAVELSNGLTAEEALSWEKELSGKGLKERIRKENKLGTADRKILEHRMKELDLEGEIIDVGDSLECRKLFRKGVFPSPVTEVKGQIVSNGRAGLILTSGKVLRKSQQKGLGDF